MTREEARKLLLGYSRFINEETDLWEALDLAIEALKQTEIVRCGECKNYKATSDPELESYCYIDGRAEMTPDGYCSWGEKKQVVGKQKSVETSTEKADKSTMGQPKSKLDCISRQQAVEAVANHFMIDALIKSPYASKDIEDWKEIAEVVLGEVPPVTPTERTGEWIVYPLKDEGRVELECPECGYALIRAADRRPHFCENCGAKMKGGTENE